MKHIRLLLFDLDGTLLTSQKTISPRTLSALIRCREKGLHIGVATSRGKQNALSYLAALQPDAVISSAGALVVAGGETVAVNGFSGTMTRELLRSLKVLAGRTLPMTVDGVEEYYRNYQLPPEETDRTWETGTLTDFSDFDLPSLKLCFETDDPALAEHIGAALPHCDLIRFSDGNWYKLTPRGVTKESAILQLCSHLGITPDEIAAFGDDYADLGMLGLCGLGIAMGNAIPEVQAAADAVIGHNDEDGIACWLEEELLPGL